LFRPCAKIANRWRTGLMAGKRCGWSPRHMNPQRSGVQFH